MRKRARGGRGRADISAVVKAHPCRRAGALRELVRFFGDIDERQRADSSACQGAMADRVELRPRGTGYSWFACA